ncbi:MAG TPA: NAD(P)H-dependent oxidoreductase subunit E [Gaiellales bacterium]|nr:NAD(P)H-dependent oxidoreductase subunit E [Gaiellales bacterium]
MTDKGDAQTLAGARETRPAPPAPLPASDDTRPLYDRIQDVIALYPERKSAVVPALRLAQDEYGWLSEQAFDEVADATGFTPAFCKSVASFYDMFRLTPTGRYEICVCTNISCALVGAADTMRAFERELGIHSGQTSEDGLFTLKTVECYGGCGWGPVVSVNERYHEPFPAAQVPELIAQLRSDAEPGA